MARPKEVGLEYYTTDVIIFENEKIQLIMSEFGSDGFVVYMKLLCLAYQKNGYYYDWNDDKKLLLAKALNLKGSLVGEIVAGLVRRSLFEKRVFDSFSVLTSKQIQYNYFEAIKKRAAVDIYQEYILVDTSSYKNLNFRSIVPENSTLEFNENDTNISKNEDENNGEYQPKKVSDTLTGVSDTLTGVSDTLTAIKGELMPQSKVKESKVEYIKEKSKKEKTYNFVSPDFKIFYDYLEYRKQQHGFTYKTEKYVQDAYNELLNLSNNDPNTAIAVVKQSIVNGWKGLFELKKGFQNANNGKFSNNGGQLSDYEKRRRLTVDEVETSRAKLIEAMQNGTVKIGFGSGD